MVCIFFCSSIVVSGFWIARYRHRTHFNWNGIRGKQQPTLSQGSRKRRGHSVAVKRSKSNLRATASIQSRELSQGTARGPSYKRGYQTAPSTTSVGHEDTLDSTAGGSATNPKTRSVEDHFAARHLNALLAATNHRHPQPLCLIDVVSAPSIIRPVFRLFATFGFRLQRGRRAGQITASSSPSIP